MANIGPMEIGIVLIIALVVFGPKRLPELGKSLGKGINEFKGSISGEHAETPAPSTVVAPATAVLVEDPTTKKAPSPAADKTGV